MASSICKIRSTYSYATIEKCSEKGCSLRINNKVRNSIVILKGEKITRNYKVCDCLIFIERKRDLIVMIVELKRKSIDVSVIKEKFENTIDLLNDIISNLNLRSPKDFFPVLLYERMRGPEFSMLKRLRLHFACETRYLILEKCGVDLSQIMKYCHNSVYIGLI